MARPLRPQTPVAERLIQARGDMPRAEVAAALEINVETLGSYERGVAFPPPTFLVAVKHLYKISLDWLITGDGQMRPLPEPPATEEAPTPAQTRRPIMRPTRRIADAPTPEPVDYKRLENTITAFVMTVQQDPDLLKKSPGDLAKWIIQGYNWIASISDDEKARIAIESMSKTDRDAS